MLVNGLAEHFCCFSGLQQTSKRETTESDGIAAQYYTKPKFQNKILLSHYYYQGSKLLQQCCYTISFCAESKVIKKFNK